VLWAAVRATQKRWPAAKIVVYTGDHDVNKAAMLERVEVFFSQCSQTCNAYVFTEPVQHPDSRSYHHISIPHNSTLGISIDMATFYPPWAIIRIYIYGI
jgi:hypothetical protein